MTNILLNWTYYCDMIECPQFIADNLSYYQVEFDKWISNPNNKHGYWEENCEGESALSFDSNAFVEWLNSIIIKDTNEKARIVKEDFMPRGLENNLPKINF